MKYTLAHIITALLLFGIAAFVCPWLIIMTSPLIGYILTFCCISFTVILSFFCNVYFDLDGREALAKEDYKEDIKIEEEKLFTVHEYRRLHEVDYMEFSHNIKLLLNKKDLK